MRSFFGQNSQRFRYWCLTILAVLALWYAAVALHVVPEFFLPSPVATGRALWYFVVSGKFITAFGSSFARIFVATSIAGIVGFFLGLLMGVSRRAAYLLEPIVGPLRYLPITALLPLIILWFGIGETMKIIFLVIGIVFYFVPLVESAVQNVPKEYYHVANSFGLSRWHTLWRITVPAAFPIIFDGLIVINGIGWTYVVLAEIINAPNGLGYLITIAGRLQQSDRVFAALILIGAVAILSDYALRRVRQRYVSW